MTISIESGRTQPLDLSAPRSRALAEPEPARIAGVGTSVMPESYSQQELLDLLAITDPKVRSIFLNSAITRRHLALPPQDAQGNWVSESQGELLAKHTRLAVDMGLRALRSCVDNAGVSLADV